MENLIHIDSIPGLLAAISIMLAIHLCTGIGKFLWSLKEKKDEVTETGIEELSRAVNLNTQASKDLEHRIKQLEKTLSDVSEIKTSTHRLFTAVRLIAGDNWETIRKTIMAEEEILS